MNSRRKAKQPKVRNSRLPRCSSAKPSGPEDVKTMGFTQTKPRASSATRQTSSTVTTSVKEKGKAAKGTELSPPKMQLSNRYDALKDKDD
ncbi:hypothetical protein HID58_085540 [Brassica napus]|uniref:Uncharacterized protein n=1 Tax=Brassica napus TaxID=3708 RepID=A0ABQ7XPC2_BRANA|nr:hypothetical protein HID58_085540 [Brassica napus]